MSIETTSWYVLYTKARNGEKVADGLSGAGYKVCCPLQKVRRQWSDQMKIIEEPLFKGYLFTHAEEAKRNEVFNLPGTVRYRFRLIRPASGS